MNHSSAFEAAVLLEDPATPAEDLAAIATAHPSLRPAVAKHPNAYPELQEWIALVSPSASLLERYEQAPGEVVTEPEPEPEPAPEPEVDPHGETDPTPPVQGHPEVMGLDEIGVPIRGASLIPWIITAASIFVALIAVGVLVLRPGASAVAERGSGTPEEAATLFAESFIAGDFETTASTFATESLVSHYSFVSHLEWQNAFAPMSGYLPAEQYGALNLEKRRGEVGTAIGQLARSALLPEVDARETYVFTDSAESALSPSDFQEGLDLSGLAALSIARVDVIEPTPGTRFAENAATATAPFGAQDTRTVAILFDTPNGASALGMEVIQYDDSWFVRHLFGGALGTPSSTLMPMSPEEYGALVDDVQRAADES